MDSAASRAMDTLLPLDMEPEASMHQGDIHGGGVVVEFGGLEGQAGQVQPAVNRMRYHVRGNGEAVVAAGLLVAVVEGVDPFLGSDGVGVHVVAVSGPVEGEEVGGPVGVQAEGGDVVDGCGDESFPGVIAEGGGGEGAPPAAGAAVGAIVGMGHCFDGPRGCLRHETLTSWSVGAAVGLGAAAGAAVAAETGLEVGAAVAGAAVGAGVGAIVGAGAAVAAGAAGIAAGVGIASSSSSPPHAAMASKLNMAIMAMVTNFVIVVPPSF